MKKSSVMNTARRYLEIPARDLEKKIAGGGSETTCNERVSGQEGKRAGGKQNDAPVRLGDR